jgi:hypothetical protein
MDVDKEKIVLGRVGARRDSRAVEHVIANRPSAVKKHVVALLADAEMHATYEAGCLGFGLTTGFYLPALQPLAQPILLPPLPCSCSESTLKTITFDNGTRFHGYKPLRTAFPCAATSPHPTTPGRGAA